MNSYSITVLIVLSAISVIVALQYLRSRKSDALMRAKDVELLNLKRERINMLERAQSKEREFHKILANTSLSHIKEKHKILREIHNKLTKIDLNLMPEESRSLLKQIEFQVQENLNTKAYWERFLIHFENVYPNFFQKLFTEYPGLSHQDIRLTAYVKMNWSSKEIALLMGVNHNSANKSRYRLRKKMQIPKDIKLDEFLAKF